MSIIYNFMIEFYLPTIHTFILARRNTIIFDSTKIIMKLARPEPEHSLLVLWLFLLCVSERGQTHSLINAGRYQSMKPMIGKSIDRSMIIDALLVNWHRLASANPAMTNRKSHKSGRNSSIVIDWH